MSTQVRVRFAPSPTGYMHLGNARTAIFNWLYARHHGEKGTFILRIEDTDKERSTDAAVEVILEGLKWLGVNWDEGPYFQSERLEKHAILAKKLLEEGKAYHCYCTPEELDSRRKEAKASGASFIGYDGRCRDRKEPREGVRPTIRLRTPDSGTTSYVDLIQGKIETSNGELDDRVILRSDGSPTYNFSCVVDDHDMNITHVIRGADHMTNTLVQVLIYEALGYEVPAFAHQSLILGPDRSKLSKRHGAVAVTDYRDMGILPEALFNALVRIGWSHGDQEIFSQEELVQLFEIADSSKSQAIFDLEKLKSMFNHHYLRAADPARIRGLLVEQLRAFDLEIDAGDPRLELLIEPLSERARTLGEMAEQAAVLFAPEVTFVEKPKKKHLKPAAVPIMNDVAERLGALDQDASDEAIMACFKEVAEARGVGMGKVAQPARVAMLGTDRSPGIELVIRVLGPKLAAQRIKDAAENIEVA